MDGLYTNPGERPDLAGIEVNAPEGYIAEKVMPILQVYQPSGKLYYHAKQDDVAAQTGRSVGVAPNKTQIGQSDLDYTASEVIQRAAIAPSAVPTMGGIEKADMIGARLAKRSVMAYREAAVAALTLGGSATDFDPGAISSQAAAAFAATKGIAGKLALVGSAKTLADVYTALLREESTSVLLARIVAGTAPGVAMEGLAYSVRAKAVSILFGCEEVYAGDDAIWNDGALEGRFAVGRFDDGGEDNHLFEPVFGRVLQYIPQSGEPISIRATADDTAINNYYTATTHMVAKVLNGGAVYRFSLT